MSEWIVAYVLRSVGLIRNRPKLKVEYTPLEGRSSTDVYGKMLVRWDYRVTITNLSKQDALEPTVVCSTNQQLQTLGVHHIRGLDCVHIKQRLEKQIDKNFVIATGSDFHGALEPSELKELALVLRYKSHYGVTCYTDYLRNRQDRPNMWSLCEPKWAKASVK